jgi:hypothetical protein
MIPSRRQQTTEGSASTHRPTGQFQETTPHYVLQRAQLDPHSLSAQDVNVLQQSVGNRATARLLRPMLQTKLTLGPAADRYETEADRVAEQVVRSTSTMPVQPKRAEAESEQQAEATTPFEPISVQRAQRLILSSRPAFQSGDIQRQPLHGPEGGEVESSVAQQIQSARGGGKPLQKSVLSRMEAGFGADFSNVRVHNGNQADILNRSLNARAFTTGNDIFFKRGEYNPGSTTGQKLIAHELTHTVQQTGSGVQRRTLPAIRQQSGDNATIQRLMSRDAFTQQTPGKRSKRLEKIDKTMKKIGTFGHDRLILSELLTAIDSYLSSKEAKGPQKAGVMILRHSAVNTLHEIGEWNVEDNAREQGVELGGKQNHRKNKYGSDFSDFDSTQYRVSGRAPNRKVEQVERHVEDGNVVYYATGIVTGFKGSAPIVTEYTAPISLGNWFPKVTHINGMNVAPKAGIMSAVALQDNLNEEIGGDNDVALEQEAVDVLYTYSAQRGNPLVDVFDCIKGKVQIKDQATRRQEEIMLDAVRRRRRVTVSAHSRGTIKTDNAVRIVHKKLSTELRPQINEQHREQIKAYWRANPIPYTSFKALVNDTIKQIADARAQKLMNQYIQLIYAGNAVLYPSAFLDFKMFVGGQDVVSMFVGTYSEVGRKRDVALGIGGSKNSKVKSVGKGKGHGFAGNYVPAVASEIAQDLRQRGNEDEAE